MIQPTIERGLITYLVFFLTRILRCGNKKKDQFDINDFSLSKFISLSINFPFIDINKVYSNNLKNKYIFYFDLFDSLIKAKENIYEFLSAITKTEIIIKNQIDIIKNLSKEMIINKYILVQIPNLLDSLKFLWNYFRELFDGVIDVQKQLTNNKRFKLFYIIANKAAENNIKDPRYFVLAYSYGNNYGVVKIGNKI